MQKRFPCKFVKENVEEPWSSVVLKAAEVGLTQAAVHAGTTTDPSLVTLVICGHSLGKITCLSYHCADLKKYSGFYVRNLNSLQTAGSPILTSVCALLVCPTGGRQ
ncbi:hypothetical protein XENOCAPTIV_020572 [Xenoophorus captivus]|uniref:Fungal lipase-like domain-containing protein n=1 Tax=Xenoophorus captivus TaxID=1517983 RepID=A0ABV0RZN8_9TELE